MISVEDLIADRMGQYGEDRHQRRSRLEQALVIYQLAAPLDEAYLDKRIRDETAAEFGLEDLKRALDGQVD